MTFRDLAALTLNEHEQIEQSTNRSRVIPRKQRAEHSQAYKAPAERVAS